VWLRAEVALQQVRVHLARGDVAAAADVLRHSGVSVDDEPVPDTDAFHLAYLRLACHQARGRDSQQALDDARAVARRIVTSAQAGERSATVLRALLLLALAEWACGDEAGALQTLERALALGEPEGYLRIFYDESAAVGALLRHARQRGNNSPYLATLIDLFPSTQAAAGETPVPAGRAALVEPLSERELEILALIRDGCSNRDIARRLSITLHTVKKHTSNIYGKLGVKSRTQAVAVARELNLLETDTTFE